MTDDANDKRSGSVGRLICHPVTPAKAVTGIDATLQIDGSRSVRLVFAVFGARLVKVPPPCAPDRTDELWTTTCFELFRRGAAGEGYTEFNFAPSGQWAAYAFEARRTGMRDLPLTRAPRIAWVLEDDRLTVTIELDANTMKPGRGWLNLAAVIEERDGTKSFWALAHPPGRPDFHDPACFVLELPAPV